MRPDLDYIACGGRRSTKLGAAKLLVGENVGVRVCGEIFSARLYQKLLYQKLMAARNLWRLVRCIDGYASLCTRSAIDQISYVRTDGR